MVKLETTNNRRRLHIGSFFSDLNETDYQELIRIFAKENVVKNLSFNPVLCDENCVKKCDCCGKELHPTYYCNTCDNDE